MKNFSAIEESHFINGPAAVDLRSAVLYINPREWNKLSPVAKNFVIAHELGHLNTAVDSEFAADKWAFWHRLELGDSSIDLLKEFYRTLPFGTPEQIQRAEEMLRTVLAGEERNETVAPLFQMIKTPVQHNGNLRNFDPITLAVSAASSVVNGIIGGIKKRKAKKAAEKEAKAIEAEEKKIQGEVQNQTLRLENEQRLLQNLEDMEAMAAAEKKQKSSKTTKNIIIVVVIALVAAGAYFYFKSKK